MIKSEFFCIIIAFALVITILIDRFDTVWTSPTDIYTVNDTIDGYIIDAVVNDNQLYAHMPNDDTVYTLTIKAENMTIWVIISTSYDDMKDHIIIEKIEEASCEQNQNRVV